MTNLYAARSRHNNKALYGFDTCVVHRVGHTVGAHPFLLAQAILGARPHLSVANWLDADKFWDAWERAGYPGLRGSILSGTGPRQWVSSPKRYFPGDDGPEGCKSYEWEHWIALKPFRRWLLRCYPTLLLPQTVVDRRRARLLRGDV